MARDPRSFIPIETVLGRKIIIRDDMITVDFSRVRSPSRALRREKAGHRQNIVRAPANYAIVSGDYIFMHPAYYARLKEERRKHDI